MGLVLLGICYSWLMHTPPIPEPAFPPPPVFMGKVHVSNNFHVVFQILELIIIPFYLIVKEKIKIMEKY
jgi:hypothetical protein